MLELRIDGTPIPQGSKIAGIRKDGKPFMREANHRLKDWREKIRLIAWHESHFHHFDGPIELAVWYYLPRPKTVTREHHTVKPDGSKLQRAIEDGLVEGGLLADDALIVAWSGRKLYEDEIQHPGVVIQIRKAGHE